MAESRTDQELLREFAVARSESAFQQLVERHVNLVFATALRRSGNPENARDLTQRVFIQLARKAAWLRPERSLSSWLHKTTVLEVRQWWRSELRRQRREQTAFELSQIMKDPDPSLEAITPVLDEALLELREPERQALLLRYFQGQSFRQIGALLGTGEDAARKRVSKALDQLTQLLRRRGQALSATGLAAVLESANQAAPLGLASVVARAGLAASSVTVRAMLGIFIGKAMAITKIQALAASLAIAALPIGYEYRANHHAKSERALLQAQVNELRQELNRQERGLATAERAFRRVQTQLTAGRRLASPSVPRSEVAPTIYPWDEQSEYVRLPKAVAPRLTFAEWDWQQHGKDRFQREQRPVLSKNGEPSPVLLDALGLTSDEAQNVCQACRNAFTEFASLAAQTSYFTNTNYSMNGNEYRTLYVPALPEGEAIRQHLREALAPQMDATRVDLFLNQIQSVCRDALNDFGRAPSAITISRNQGGRLTYGEMFCNPDGSARLNRAGPNLHVALPEALRPILQEWTVASAQVQASTP